MAGPRESEAAEAEFAEFWQAYPAKKARAKALEAYRKVCGEHNAIMAGLRRYVQTKPLDRAWLHPTTFLNQRRWEDMEPERPFYAPSSETRARCFETSKPPLRF